jgi:geranylgeranyl reductase family protein
LVIIDLELIMKTLKFDIIIVGGGPAGSTCALKLSQSNLKVALVEKATFPRDKICGDAIPGPAFKVLNSISPTWADLMNNFSKSQDIKSSKIISTNNSNFTINWFTKSYNSKRIDFDSFLFDIVKQDTLTEIFEGVNLKSIKVNNGTNLISGTDSNDNEIQFQSKLIIGADGANGICSKKLGSIKMDKNHHCAAVRAYVKDIKGLEKGTNEFYLIKGFTPGYFWIFPLDHEKANIGFGMISNKISEKRLSLKKALKEIISNHPTLKERFRNSTFESDIKGFGLPLGSRFAKISGAGFMLCGDAASLIDPLQGHGIDKAMWSGKWAAEQAIKCFSLNNFDVDFLKDYDKKVYQKFGPEFRRNYWILKIISRFPTLLNLITFAAQNRLIKSFMQKFT